MELEDFKEALENEGLDFKESGQSLVLKTCPACGSDKFKVHMRREVDEKTGLIFGRCYAGSCQTNYSSIKYLLQAGMAYGEVMKLHGKDGEAALKALVPGIKDLSVVEPEIEKVEVGPTEVDITPFFSIKDWIDHPASKYALKRGARPEWEFVMVDHEGCAVVFVVYEDGKPIGYQRRFLHPDHPDQKTKTSYGFTKTNHILSFPREGADIVVCEGPFTAIAAWHFGYYGVCTFGAGVSNKQIGLILELADKLKVNVGVAFDEDKAGLVGFNRIRSAMYWLEKKTYKVRPSTGNDLNDAWMAGGKAVIQEEKHEYSPALPELPRFI